jgi:hypothetical protein
MAEFGNMPFGLREVVLVNIGGTAYAALPAAQTMKWGIRIDSDELKGNDATQAVVAFLSGVEWELEDGGISIEALTILTGLTGTVASTTPNRSYSMYGTTGAALPYFKIYGRALGAGVDDVHVRLLKCKVTDNIEGEFANGEFYVTKCKGIGITDGTNVFQIMEHEAAQALPTT